MRVVRTTVKTVNRTVHVRIPTRTGVVVRPVPVRTTVRIKTTKLR